MKELKPAYLTGNDYADSLILELLTSTDREADFIELYETVSEADFLKIVENYASNYEIYLLTESIDEARTSLLLTQENYWPIVKEHGYRSDYGPYDPDPDARATLPSYYTYVLHTLGVEDFSESLRAGSELPHAIPLDKWYGAGPVAWYFTDAGNNILHCRAKIEKGDELTLFTLQRLENHYSITSGNLTVAEHVLEWVNPAYIKHIATVLKVWAGYLKELPYSVNVYARPNKARADFRPIVNGLISKRRAMVYFDQIGELVNYLEDHANNFNGPEPK